MLLHVLWSGPYHLEQALDLHDEDSDYGVYQIYGAHFLYGADVLLYIGKADQQTFGTRLRQHAEQWMRDESEANRLTGLRGTPSGRPDASRARVKSANCDRRAVAHLRAYPCV